MPADDFRCTAAAGKCREERTPPKRQPNNDDGRVFQEGAGNRDTLPLPFGEGIASEFKIRKSAGILCLIAIDIFALLL